MSDKILIKGKKVDYIETEVNILDVIEQILKSKGWNNTYSSYVCVDDNKTKIIRNTDISRHGLPLYEKSVLSEDFEDVDLFIHLKCIEKYYKRRN